MNIVEVAVHENSLIESSIYEPKKMRMAKGLKKYLIEDKENIDPNFEKSKKSKKFT
jgi:hypothetical protein